MTIKDILVHLDDSSQSETRMRIAVALAKAHDAHITADHTFSAHLADDPKKALAAPEEAFRRRTADAGIDADFCGYFGEPHTIMALHAQLTDIVIASHSQSSIMSRPSLAEELLIASGKPVVVVCDCNGRSVVGKRVLVAWNQTREASRAVADSLPILEKAEEVTVVSVHAPMTGGFATGEFLTYLSRHGVRARGHHELAPDGRVGEALIKATEKLEADLVVMGAYGRHSRLREVAFGGTTRHVLGHATVPVLMSH